MRGTGADGLQALTWQRPLTDNIMLVRPLLEVNRSQTEQFCQEYNLPIWEDSTNQNLQYARNRIRQELIPYLKANFNPQVEANLAQTAELLQAEVEYLEQKAHQLRLEASVQGEKGNLKVNRCLLKKVPLALQRRVMRQLLQEILPDAPNFEHIEKITALITAPNRSRTDPFPGDWTAIVQGDWIYIYSKRLGHGLL
jgi:tRNA(Ile)-lysidine synthase